MKIWIVYDSKFGNNKRIAEHLGDQFKEENDVRVFYAKKISPHKVLEEGIDMFLFGGPLRAGNISFTMKTWANKLAKLLKKQNKQVKIAAVWGSHGTNTADTPPKFAWDNSKGKWKAVLDAFPAEKKLPDVIGFDVNPKTLEGPLEDGWEERALNFANMIKQLE
jgi:flavodoxin